MSKKKRHKSTIIRAAKVRALTEAHYECGNQSRCYKAVWRRWIYPEFGLSYRTYLNLLGIAPEGEAMPVIPGIMD